MTDTEMAYIAGMLQASVFWLLLEACRLALAKKEKQE